MKSYTNNTVTSLILVLLTISLVSGQKSKATDSKARFVHEPDMKKLLPRFLNAQGFLDPKFAEAVAKPSAYYTDFYGIQALADTTKEEIKKDFVPKYAEIVKEDENTLELKFKSSWTGTFYPHSLFKAFGQEVPFDHVEVSGATWQELQKNLEDFRGILLGNKWEKRYLIPNPFYKDELIVAKNYSGNVPPAKVAVSPVLTEMQGEENAVLIYGEGVHGNIEGYNKFHGDVLQKYRFDWIGMEMLAPAQQKDLDAFVKSADNSAEYKRARRALIDYFVNSWNGRSGPKTTGEENYYFKIVDLMRSKKTRVIGMEGSTMPFIFFRYGENQFGAAVRSYLWAKTVPKKGKGLVYGGGAHFNSIRPINFQDFLKMLNPDVKLFMTDPRWMPPAVK